ncbi:MAG: LysR family transcriptional regulator [Rhodobacter sp.]|nr:LysR family transcriptional regulator [Paracoccaceae bacterium]MCC0076562.1 LysR family transcriptional regulator [Rhodobacter sp.]
MISARYLAQIAVIAELGSISRAAEHLNVTQPTLSRTVKIVEDAVGARIFRRTRTGVAPTEIGARLVAEGREIVEHTRAAQQAVEQWKSGLNGPLRIGTGPMLASTFLDDVLVEAVVARWPYALTIVVRPAAELLAELAAGRLDVVLAPAKLEVSAQDLRCEPLFEDRLAVFGSIDDPLTDPGATVDPAQLTGPWVDYALMTGLLNSTDRLLGALGLPHVQPVFRVAGDITMGLTVVRRQRGYCFLPERAAERLRSTWGLARVPVALPSAALEIALWTHARNENSPAIRRFRKALQAKIPTA